MWKKALENHLLSCWTFKSSNEKSRYSEIEVSVGDIVDYYTKPAYEVVLCTLTRIFRDKSMSIKVFVILASASCNGALVNIGVFCKAK